MPRNFALILDKKSRAKWDKVGLNYSEVFLSSDQALNKWVAENSDHSVSYSPEIAQLMNLEKELLAKAEKVDPTLGQHIEAIHAAHIKRVQKAEKKILRAEKRKYQDKKQQIEAVKSSLFPEGSLQERKDNFLNFYLKNNQFIQSLLDTFDAFEYKMYILLE